MMNLRNLLLLAAAGMFLSACSLTSAVFSDRDSSGQDEVVMEDGASMMEVDEDVPEEKAPSFEADSAPDPSAALETSSGCFNSFYPVVEGRTWTYLIDSGDDGGSTYSHSYREVTDNSFIVVTSFDQGIVVEVGWECNEGSLISTEFVNFNILDMDVDFETIDYSGIWLPSDDDWQVGKEWEARYVVNYTGEVEGFSFESTMVFNLVNTISAVEPVSVPAGNYSEAYRVDAAGTILIEDMGAEMPVNYSSWFVRDVGMVLSSSNDADAAYLTELLSVD